MKRIFAIFAMLLTVGFLNGANAFSTHQSSDVVVQSEIAGDQFVAPSHGESHHSDENGCCWDSLCFCSNHCHHGGATAWLSSAEIISTPNLTKAFEVTSDDIHVLALNYLLIDPPRA